MSKAKPPFVHHRSTPYVIEGVLDGVSGNQAELEKQLSSNRRAVSMFPYRVLDAQNHLVQLLEIPVGCRAVDKSTIPCLRCNRELHH